MGPGPGHPHAVGQTRSQRLEQRIDAGDPGGAHRYHTSVVLKCVHVVDLQIDRPQYILIFIMSSHSPAVACGERGSSLGSVRQQSLLQRPGQQGPERTAPGDLQTHRLHDPGEITSCILSHVGLSLDFN